MADKDKWILTNKEREIYIEALTDELAVLRAKADISQDELAKLIGISRQTYGAIERKKRKMSWNTYLSLILFFDYTESTSKMIRSIKNFPHRLIDNVNKNEKEEKKKEDFVSDFITNEINQKLDERALHAIKTVVMMEYARCSELTSDAILKSLSGKIVSNNKEGSEI